jgi:hypothetical protein
MIPERSIPSAWAAFSSIVDDRLVEARLLLGQMAVSASRSSAGR